MKKNINLSSIKLTKNLFIGNYRSFFKGNGFDLESIRPYLEGDDLKYIDWNNTLKNNKLYTKIFKEDRDIEIIFIVDFSKSITSNNIAFDNLKNIFSLLLLASISNNDKVGAIFFTDKIEKVFFPKRNKRYIHNIFNEFKNFKPKNKGSNLKYVLKFILKNIKRLNFKKSNVIFILSDFFTSDFSKELSILSKNQTIIAILFESIKKMKNFGYIDLKDNENDNIVSFYNENNFVYFNKYIEDHKNILYSKFKKNRVDLINISQKDDALKKIYNYFVIKKRLLYKGVLN